jgi:hypothetical protein
MARTSSRKFIIPALSHGLNTVKKTRQPKEKLVLIATSGIALLASFS